MTELVVSEPIWNRLSALAAAPVESGAALFLRPNAEGDCAVVHHVVEAAAGDCLAATATEFTYAPQFLTRMTRLAAEGGYDLALFHTHPSGYPDFSVTDDHAEAGLMPFMQRRLPDRPSFSLMMCDGRLIGRLLGTHAMVAVRRVGSRIERFSPLVESVEVAEVFDRQIRAFGADGQATLADLQVAVVGLGGTGSLVAQQLAHLGIGALTLIDDDAVETTNLNRVVGARPESVGELKVDIARAMVIGIRPTVTVRTLAASVTEADAKALLCRSDAIFICTDSHVSRAFVNDVAYQYVIPAFDMGLSIATDEAAVASITGRVQMLAPGLPCLWCTSAISPRAIREELQGPEAQAADPYFRGNGVKQPAVVSLNSTVASLAVTMFLGAFTRIPVEPRYQMYDAVRGTVRSFAFKCQPTCSFCGPDGVMAQADLREIPLMQKRKT
jgi:molybdopterin-synthase adenylyltransferase